jgi:outer membrane protein assembly factor BamE
MMRTALLFCLAALCVANSACSSSYVPNVLRPYRPDVQQGNIITRDMVEQLRPGMTRDQVRFLLGTPMLTDIFHQDRWDYTYYLRRKSGETQIRKLSIRFAEGKLTKFDSDAMPTEPLADSLILGQKAPKPVSSRPPAVAPAPAALPPGTQPGPADPGVPPGPVPAPAPGGSSAP